MQFFISSGQHQAIVRPSEACHFIMPTRTDCNSRPTVIYLFYTALVGDEQVNTIRNRYGRFMRLLAVLCMIFPAGCRPAPAADLVHGLVTQHFETEKYHVSALEIGEISSLSPGEKTYMGTPGYLIEIKTITLEIRQDIGRPVLYRKGQQVTFRDARMNIREHPGGQNAWIITGISGIPVP